MPNSMEKTVLIEVSARHIHITKEDLEALFGAGYELTKKKDLSQPGEFACEEKLTVIGPKKELPGVSILGPVRKATQVELSLTDARSIGLGAPVRESGNVEGTPGCRLAGPKGEIELSQGVIAAKRHIHLTPAQAAQWGLANQQTVSVRVNTPDRSGIFGDVVVRVNSNFSQAMHIDTDECNALGITGNMTGEILV